MSLGHIKREFRLLAGRAAALVPGDSLRFGPPRGYCHPASDWFRDRDPAAGVYVEAGETDARELPAPVLAQCADPERALPAGRIHPAPDWAARIEGGRYLDDPVCVLTPDDRLLPEISLWCGDDFSRHAVFSRMRLPKARELPGTTVMFCANHPNYYHLLIEAFPKVALLSGLGIDVSGVTHLITCDGPASPAEAELLGMTGLAGARRLPFRGCGHLRCERLVVTSPPQAFGRWSIDWLRGLFPSPARNFGKLWISRSRARSRRLRDEAKLDPVLRAHGYEKVELEGMSVAEQARLFGSAHRVAALHGAGLANLVFMPPGGRVLEIRAEEHVSAYAHLYRRLSALAGHEWGLITLPGLGTGSLPEHLDMDLDPELLDRALGQMEAP